VLFVFVKNFKFFATLLITMLLIGHDLHHVCGLHVIGVFNLFEHYISLEILVVDSCVGLKRLHVFDSFFTCTLA
jgi:hypothetical protein